MITLNTKLVLTLLMIFVLTILPLPYSINVLRPAWILLLVLYVQCCLPMYFRVSLVFLLGLILDVLSASIMGQHAFALVLASWLANVRSSSFAHYSILQQMSIVLLFCLVYQLSIYIIDAFLGISSNIFYSIATAFTSVLVWPWLRLLFSSPLMAL